MILLRERWRNTYLQLMRAYHAARGWNVCNIGHCTEKWTNMVGFCQKHKEEEERHRDSWLESGREMGRWDERLKAGRTRNT